MINLDTMLSKKQLKQYKAGKLSDIEITNIIKNNKNIIIDINAEKKIVTEEATNWINNLVTTAPFIGECRTILIECIKDEIDEYLTESFYDTSLMTENKDFRLSSIYDSPSPDDTIKSVVDKLYIIDEDDEEGDKFINLGYDLTKNILLIYNICSDHVSSQFKYNLLTDGEIFNMVKLMNINDKPLSDMTQLVIHDLYELVNKSVSEYCEESEDDSMIGYLSVCENIHKIKPNITSLYNDIMKIPGEKTLTITSGNLSEKIEIDGIEPECDKGDFLTFLTYCFSNSSAGIGIRQRTGEFINDNNIEKHKVNIYAVQVSNGIYKWTNEEEMFEAYYTDCSTGDIRPIEPDVNCCGYYF